MATWNEVSVGGGMSLLPEGIRTYVITTARVDVSKRGAAPALRELIVALSSTEGAGEVTVPLEPFIHTPDGVELWERLFKSAAQGLGFTPTNPDGQMKDLANEFASWIPTSGLVGSAVECDVKHVPGKKLKDDGTPFINHRVTFRGVVAAAQPAQAAPATETYAGIDEDPWA